MNRSLARVLVTGASGFVGGAVVKTINSGGFFHALPVFRNPSSNGAGIVIEDFLSIKQWLAAVKGVDTIVHCAARAHVMKERASDALAAYRVANVEATTILARAAIQAGVKRFIFVSSIKVNGEQTTECQRFTPEDVPAPEDPYGVSKAEAEEQLFTLGSGTDMEVVVIRPVLVYGPGVKGNFATMVRLLEKGIPLPLGLVHNRRSMVALDNLVDLIITCINHPAAANQVFLAGDGEDTSIAELLRVLARIMGRPSRLLPVPPRLLELVAGVSGKRDMARRILGSLQVDISKNRDVLGWEPPYSLRESLERYFK